MTTPHINSSKGSPCPLCGRTKDRDCKFSEDVCWCHHGNTYNPPQLAVGDTCQGKDGQTWALVDHNTDPQGRWAPLSTFKVHKPRDTPAPQSKPKRRKQHREWSYLDAQGNLTITVLRDDDGEGNKAIKQRSNIAGKKPGEVQHLVTPYKYADALQALADGAPYVFWVEGETCADALWAQNLPAITSLRGSGGFDPSRDAVDIQPDRLCVVPDRDKVGLKYADKVAANNPGCCWFYPFKGTPEWNGKCPDGGGVDVADWLELGGTVEQLLAGIQKQPAHGSISAVVAAAVASLPEPTTLDELLGPVNGDKLRRPQTDKLTKAVGLVLPLRFNELTQRIENDGEEVDGDFLGTLYLQLAEGFQLEVSKDRAADAAMVVARRHSYHPVRDYLNSLSSRLDPLDWEQIAACCFSTPEPWAQVHLQRQLIGLIARVLQSGCKLDTSLVIHSPKQGIGKSKMWAILGGEWFNDSLGDLRNLKDDVLQLHSAWIHEWGEIDAVVGKRESETLKKFLSAQKDNVRKPYGRGVETLRRSCGIVGTTNRADFIKDPTGNRRFPVISVGQVNTDWIADNRDAIWGSALAAYRAGNVWHYANHENELISAAARQFAAEDVVLDAVESWCEDHPDLQQVAVARVIFDINRDRLGDQEYSRQIALRLGQLGWVKTGNRERGILPDGSRHDKASIWHCPTP